MKKSILLALTALMVLAALFSGCETTKPLGSTGATDAPEASGTPETGSTPETGIVTEADVPYAAAMAGDLIAAIEGRDYKAFSKDLGDTMKTAMTEEAFNSLADFLASKIGSFQQLSFGEGANMTQDGVTATVIVYIAKYSEEPEDVLITVTFTGEGEKKIEGLYFNSPKLREQ